MNSEQLAKAIVALYTTTSRDGQWTDTDELIQQQAFRLWEVCEWSSERMAVYLWRNGWNVENACAFANNLHPNLFWQEVKAQFEDELRMA